jgi:hypothetical protein
MYIIYILREKVLKEEFMIPIKIAIKPIRVRKRSQISKIRILRNLRIFLTIIK